MRGRIEGRVVYENHGLVETGKSNSETRAGEMRERRLNDWSDARRALEWRTLWRVISFALFEIAIGTKLERLV
jgi:hypothetical protein